MVLEQQSFVSLFLFFSPPVVNVSSSCCFPVKHILLREGQTWMLLMCNKTIYWYVFHDVPCVQSAESAFYALNTG